MRALACLLLLCLVGFTWAAEPDSTIRNEDIVRWYVSGVTEAELIERIAAAEVDFQLDEEMQNELGITGLPRSVIDAMVARQDEMHPAPVEAEAAEPAPAELVIRFNADRKKKAATIRLLDEIDPALIRALELNETDRRFTDLAIFVFCRTADHVPDQWRGKSPLGRDFTFSPRHRLLHFEPGAEHVPANKLKEWVSRLGIVPGARRDMPDLTVLRLPIPESLTLPLERDIAHDITVGVAVQVGSRYFGVAQLERDAVVLEDEELVLNVVIRDGRGRDPRAIRLNFEAN